MSIKESIETRRTATSAKQESVEAPAAAPATSEAAFRASCRSCGKRGLLSFLDLGHTPLADGLVSAEQLAGSEATYPLEVTFCPECALVQILETVPPETLFCQDYPYYSSFSDYWLRHSRENALDLIERCGLDERSFVVEIASNDGYLLRNFVERKIPVLGIDPAEGPVAAARELGIPTSCTFFTLELAEQLRSEGRSADVIIANNVLAHVAQTNDFVEGMRTLLKPDGLIAVEVPYVRDLVEHCEFDTIYHQHLCYFSVTALDALFRRHQLYVNHVKRLPSHGGSLRVYAGRRDDRTDSVRSLLQEERALGVDQFEYFADFSKRVHKIAEDLRRLLVQLKTEGARMAGYGAAAKACTLLNFTGIGTDLIEYVVDRNVHKQGKYLPVARIPIKPVEQLMAEFPDYVVLLVWNLADEITSQQRDYRDRGGKFIVPIPEIHML